MKDFEEIGKRMPYAEDPEYIQSMIDSKVDKVLNRQDSRNRSVFVRRVLICTASAAALFGIFFLADVFVKNDNSGLLTPSGITVKTAEVKPEKKQEVMVAKAAPVKKKGPVVAEIKSSKSLDEVLASMDEEQIDELLDYSLEDIPEYYSEEY